MPELPEVETVRRQLDQRLRGSRIVEVNVWKSGRERPAGADFVEGLRGKVIVAIERRAKLLIWRFADGEAMIGHLKMTGRFLFVEPGYQPQKHDCMRFLHKDERGQTLALVWADVRRFGFLRLVSAEELKEILAGYGPEPLIATVETLADRFLRPKSRTLKAALLDQTTVAGVGNIYADEACHRAGICPTRRLASLKQSDRLNIAHSIQSVLKESLEQQGTSANDYVDTRGEKGGFLELLCVYGREGKPCLTCQTPIKRMVLHQRGTHFCPSCQR